MSIEQLLPGTWRLAAYEIENSDGVVSLPFGGEVTGLLIYTPEGFMSGQVMRKHRASTAEEGYIAYCGRWRVDHDRGEVIHIVEASLLPKWVGSEQRRRVRFDDSNRLTLSAPFVKDGVSRTAVLRWQRVSH